MYKVKSYLTKDWQLIKAFIAQGIVPGAAFCVDGSQEQDPVILNLDGNIIALRQAEFKGISCDG